MIASYLGTDERAINRSGAEGEADGIRSDCGDGAPYRAEPGVILRRAGVADRSALNPK